MPVFTSPSFRGHEQVVFCQDGASGLKAIIAIHDTTLGPALGGCRMWRYDNEQDAIEDALRLSRGMTYKAAMANLPFGGGKSVILGDPVRDKSDALLEAFGRHVDRLGGRYITAEDVGTSPRDLEIVHRTTQHVAGISTGGAGNGDPSPATAWGVFHGIRAVLSHRLGKSDFAGVTVALQGLGHVGQILAKELRQAGAQLVVADIDPSRVAWAKDELGAQAVHVDGIYDIDADVFAPCALGAAINDETVHRLKVKAVAGSANNQLAQEHHAAVLQERGILYAPDYVINAGGIINISHEGPGYDRKRAFDHCARIYDTLMEVFARAERNGLTTNDVSDHIAEERLQNARTRQAPLPLARAV